MRRWIVCAFLLATMALTAFRVQPASAASLPKGVPAGSIAARVVARVDGDTIQTRFGGKTYTVDLFSVDAPELDPAECFGAEAQKYIQGLLPKNTVVYLEADKAAPGKDTHVSRYVWATNSKGKSFLLNQLLLSKGYGVFAPAAGEIAGKYDKKLSDASALAQRNSFGLWGKCASPHDLLPPPVVDTPTPEPTPTETPVPAGGITADEQAYIDAVQPIVQLMTDSFDGLHRDVTASDIGTPDWQSRFVVELAGIQEAYREILTVAPPDSFADSYNLLVQGMSLYNDAVNNIAAGLDNNDPSLIYTAEDELSQGNDYVNQATAALAGDYAVIAAR